MDYAQPARQLALSLSDRDISEGLAEANDARRKDSVLTSRWVGLPPALQKKMVGRTAAGLGVDTEWDLPYLAGVLLTVAGSVLTIMTSILTVTGLHVGMTSTEAVVLWVVSLATLASGVVALRIGRTAVPPELALTPMEEVVVRGYIAAPPNLLQPLDASASTRLAALAGLASRDIQRCSAWKDGRSLVDPTGLDLDRSVVTVYEFAYQINEAQDQLSAMAGSSDSFEPGGALAELAGVVRHAESVLEALVTELCAYADSLLCIEKLSRAGEPPTAATERAADIMVSSLLTSAAAAEGTAKDLHARWQELDELKASLDERKAQLFSSWPGEGPDA